MFVDDVLIFCSGSARDVNTISDILALFAKATGMEINAGKSSLSTHLLSAEELRIISGSFPYRLEDLDGGLKYLGFCLKPNDYQKQDWKWLLDKMEKCLNIWSHKWLSRAGKLVLVKVVLEAIQFTGCHWHGSQKASWKRPVGLVSNFCGVVKRRCR